MRYPKKFDLVHQTISPRERVESGDKTSLSPQLGRRLHLSKFKVQGLVQSPRYGIVLVMKQLKQGESLSAFCDEILSKIT